MANNQFEENQLPKVQQETLNNLSVGGNLTVGDINQILIVIQQNGIPKPKGIPQNILSSGTIKFVGRAEILEQLHQTLEQDERVIIQGMGGIGKTELAIQYSLVHLLVNTYPGGICWLRARDEDIGIQIVDFAKTKLGLKPPSDAKLLLQIDFCWSNWSEGNVLIVLDDVTDYRKIESYLPPQRSRFKVLITTRLQLDFSHPLRFLTLDVLTEASAFDLLREWIGKEKIDQQLDDTKAICERLGYLPLALNLVGRYVKKRKIFIAEMLKRLEEKGLHHKALDVDQKDRTWTLNIQRGVTAAFELSWEELSEYAQKLGCLLSLFALAPIPWDLVESVEKGMDKEELEDARINLEELHLLQGDNLYKLHQLIREFFQDKLNKLENSDILKQNFAKTIATIAKDIFVESPSKHIDDYIPHLAEVDIYFRDYLNQERKSLRWLYIGLGRLHSYGGYYTEAKRYCEQCLNISRQSFEEYHVDVGDDYNSLGLIFYYLSQYQEAEQNLQKSLKIREKLFDKYHPYLAEINNNLGMIYLAMYDYEKDYEKAEIYLKKSLNIRQEIFRLNSSKQSELDIAESFNNLAGLYSNKGQTYESHSIWLGSISSQNLYNQAQKLCHQALDIREKLLGKNHYDVIQNQINLAEIYRLLKNYNQAELLGIRALDSTQLLLGEKHLKVADIYNNLGVIYAEQKKFQEAIKNIEQALDIFQKILGNQHPRTLATKKNLQTIREESMNF